MPLPTTAYIVVAIQSVVVTVTLTSSRPFGVIHEHDHANAHLIVQPQEPAE